VTEDALTAVRAAPAAANWLRRGIVGLWLLVLLVAGVGLAVRWDALISRLAWQPAAAEGGGEPVP
jgi:hypothetical protein